jgi:diguanylate cyclase (GGDEF)-like protein/PAS domain S-box-containing protein
MEQASRPRLSSSQRVLMAVLGVLIVAVQVMILQAYRAQSSTIRLLDTAQEALTDLHNAHREAFKLAGAVDQLHQPDGLEEVELRRGLLDRQLEVTLGASEDPQLREGLADIRAQLAAFDTDFARLQAHPTSARRSDARARLHRRVDEVEALLKAAVGQAEVQFLGAIQQALQARAGFQRLLIGTSGLTLAVALVLALSLRRRASRAFTRAYAQVVAEVNERKLAEQALRESEQELRASEQRFRALVHQASDVFTVVDPHGRIRYQSPAIEPVLGYPADQLMGTRMEAVVEPDDQEAFRELLGKSLARPSASVVAELRLRPHAEPQASRRFEMTITNLLDDPTVGGLVLNYRDITERALYQEQLTQQAFQDPLTGLPNRARLMERLDFALGQRGSSVGLLFLDLDGFKQVNDTLGHDAGDELLRQVSRRFSGCLREGDVLARLGGDEFIVLLPGAGHDEAALVIQRLKACLVDPFALAGATVTVGASIGVATGLAGQCTARDLLREADRAMYRAKVAARTANARLGHPGALQR